MKQAIFLFNKNLISAFENTNPLNNNNPGLSTT